MQVQLSEFDEHLGESELICPHCECTDLHHDRVDVFERDEDVMHGLHVAVEGKQVVIDDKIEANPSRRRHGLLIRFWCEHCDEHPTLSLVQHKGKTYLRWQES